MRARAVAVVMLAVTMAASGCSALEPQSPSSTPPRWRQTTSRTPDAPSTPTPSNQPAAATTPDALGSAKLATNGFGPLRLGMSETELYAKGWLDMGSTGCPRRPTTLLTDRGISDLAIKDGKLVAIHTNSPTIATPSGVSVGMSLDDLRAKVGPQLTDIPPEGQNNSREFGVTSSAKQSLIFRTNLSGKRITHIVAYDGPAKRLSEGGC